MEHLQFIENLSKKIKETLSNSPASDLEHNINALLQGIFTKLALVSREEFDVQSQILLQTQNKLKELEEKLSALENNQS